MKFSKLLFAAFVSFALALSSCGGGDNGDEPEIPETPATPDTPDNPSGDLDKPLSELLVRGLPWIILDPNSNIIGDVLIQDKNRIYFWEEPEVEYSGTYEIDEEEKTLSATLKTKTGNEINFTWLITDAKYLDRAVKVMSGYKAGSNFLLCQRSSQSLTAYIGIETDIEYDREGAYDVSDFRSYDTSIVKVNPKTGALTGIKEGHALVGCNTSLGHTLFGVDVVEKPQKQELNLAGTWISELGHGNMWQELTLNADGTGEYHTYKWGFVPHLADNYIGTYSLFIPEFGTGHKISIN